MITPFGAGKLLKALDSEESFTPPVLKAALFTTAPFIDDDTYGTEVIGGSYARVTISLGNWVAATTYLYSDADITFSSMPACDVNGVALMDASDNMWWYVDLTDSPVIFGAGEDGLIAAANLIIGL